MASPATVGPPAPPHPDKSPHPPSLKRPRSSEDDTGASSPTKKHKVDFNEHVTVHPPDDPDDKPDDLVREEVRSALSQQLQGNGSKYDQLKQYFTTKPHEDDALSTKLLQKYVTALSGHSSSLNRTCASLVHAVLKCRWLGRDQEFVNAYARLLANIISSHGGFTQSVLHMLVGKFDQLRATEGKLPNHEVIKLPVLRKRVHSVLGFLLRLIPSANASMTSVLIGNFPYIDENVKRHKEYIGNILRLAEYAVELKDRITSMVTERLVKIDVQMQTRLEDLEEGRAEVLLKEIFQEQNDEDGDSDDTGDSSDDDEDLEPDLTAVEKQELEFKTAMGKQDAVMTMLFEFYDPVFRDGKDSAINQNFPVILHQFVNTVLPSYRSRHTQFLIFHFAQSSPALIERFTESCANIIQDMTRPRLVRMAAAAYLSSFIARGARIPARMVKDVVDLLASQLEKLRSRYEIDCQGPDYAQYAPFYGAMQALMYIFCFRWRDLIMLDDDSAPFQDEDIFDCQNLHWHPGLFDTLDKCFHSRLNPLRICAPQIVSQFSRIANMVKFAYVHLKLDSNKRVRLSKPIVAPISNYTGFQRRDTALTVKSGESGLIMEAYFPFDPYQLPRSKKWVESDYLTWKSIRIGDDEEDDSDSDGDVDVDDDEVGIEPIEEDESESSP
ncbi:RNA polymerase I-specific transcription initiation factor RRN3 [Aulographum hederae CBS 113979]|uniref:RNA polymerase I-specific transcription initiation factor RRN3 n=1 Tax=Aulographum hederae CBS 113979 TaxID=1176131 RepID=A0A6G1H9M2_9PEZI|nr:RNA polymerase I-specific transcription initiation factor RRN3 [Aulographum hederae CBS 113979]